MPDALDGNDWRHGSSGFNVTFISQVGDVPLLTTSPPSNATETVKGTKENLGVRRQGYATTSRDCVGASKGFVGSDGDGNPVGGLRDCGRIGTSPDGPHLCCEPRDWRLDARPDISRLRRRRLRADGLLDLGRRIRPRQSRAAATAQTLMSVESSPA